MKCSWGSIVARSTLLEFTVWCRQATAHYQAWYWPQNMMLYGVIMPQWLKFSNCIMEKERTMPCNRFIISDQSCPPYCVCQVFSSKEMRGNSSNVYLLVLALSDSMYLVSVFLTKVLPLLRCLHFNDAEEADIYNKIDFICKVSYQLQHSLCHRCHHNEAMRYTIVEVCTYFFVLCYDVVIFRGLRPGWRGLLSKCTRTRANMKCQSWGHKAGDWTYLSHKPESIATTNPKSLVLITIETWHFLISIHEYSYLHLKCQYTAQSESYSSCYVTWWPLSTGIVAS